jgi:subtilisin family serine protease
MKHSIRDALDLPWQDLLLRPLAPVDVAILDSGIDATHPAMHGRVVESFAVAEDETIVPTANDGNNDLLGHGTAVASIIARTAPNARLYDVRVLGSGNRGAEEVLRAGLRLAVERGWAVLNLSLAAGYRLRSDLQELCERAYYRGQTLVAARRNIPIGGDGLPAEFSAAIGVDLGPYEAPFHFGFHPGLPIEFAAGGEGVTAAAPGGGWTTMTGTSFATPAVSGLCALLLGAFPELQSYEIKTILRFRAMVEAAG